MPGGAPKQPRKGPKLRRHTTAAKFTLPQGSLAAGDGPGLDGLAGRPANPE